VVEIGGEDASAVINDDPVGLLKTVESGLDAIVDDLDYSSRLGRDDGPALVEHEIPREDASMRPRAVGSLDAGGPEAVPEWQPRGGQVLAAGLTVGGVVEEEQHAGADEEARSGAVCSLHGDQVGQVGIGGNALRASRKANQRKKSFPIPGPIKSNAPSACRRLKV
jgi:hypothetical protein